MIYIKMKGGLGNQMFEYAFALSLANKTNDKICLDLSGISNLTHNIYSLNHFNIGNVQKKDKVELSKNQEKVYRIVNSLSYRISKYFNELVNYKFQKNIQKIINRKGIYYCQDGYVKMYPTNTKDKYADGYFQCSKYFDDIKEDIINCFEVIDEPLEQNKKILSKIKKTNSVCVHIRRGDYTTISNHLVCTIDYYKKAVNLMKTKQKDAEFFIFSDDIKWVKENIDFGFKVNYIENDNPNYEELRLMYNCKHFIISNSSFSWWAQYLSKNSKKIVIAPSKWFNNPKQRADIMQDEWIRIDV